MPADLSFQFEPMHEVLAAVRAALAERGEVRFSVPNPDLGLHLYPGERTGAGIYRPYQTWLDLADRLNAHFLTPEPRGEQVVLHLKADPPIRRGPRGDKAQRYGAETDFQRIDKLEEPGFLLDLQEALARADLRPGARVLALGVNSGSELRLLDLAYPGQAFEVVGVDHSASALKLARARFPQHPFSELDLNALPTDLGRFDLVLALSVLQSPDIDTDRLLAALLRHHLAPGGALILSFPNARYIGHRLSYGARTLNFARPELGLLVRDVAHVRRQLHRKGFQVTLTGQYELVLTAARAERG